MHQNDSRRNIVVNSRNRQMHAKGNISRNEKTCSVPQINDKGYGVAVQTKPHLKLEPRLSD